MRWMKCVRKAVIGTNENRKIMYFVPFRSVCVSQDLAQLLVQNVWNNIENVHIGYRNL